MIITISDFQLGMLAGVGIMMIWDFIFFLIKMYCEFKSDQ